MNLKDHGAAAVLGFCMYKAMTTIDKYSSRPCCVFPSVFLSFLPQQDSRLTQQTLLEVNKTMERLQEEKALLEGTLKYYSAATALEGVFGGGSGSSSASSTEGAKGASSSEVQPPPGGPD